MPAMRLSLAILTAAIVSVSAASPSLWSRQQFPTCSGPCLAGANLGGCQRNDYGCLCKNDAYINNLSACFVRACSGAALQDAVEGAKVLCAAVGVTITNSLPTPTATASGSSNTSTSTSTTATPATTSNAALANAGLTRNALAGIVAFGLGLGALAL